MTRIRRTVALLSVLALFALSTLGAGWVVCAGADGHVAIESLATGCCGDDSEQPGAPEHEDENDCGDCSDVLLAQLNPVRDVEPERLDIDVTNACVGTIDDVFAPAARALRCAPRGPPRPPPLARHLTTTVLRL